MTDSLDILAVYLGRLRDLRRRESEKLSKVDFDLFTSTFDRLIEKTEQQIADLQRSRKSVAPESCTPWLRGGYLGRSMQPSTCFSAFRFTALPGRYISSGIASIGGFERKAGRLYSDSFEIENAVHDPALRAAS